MDEICLSICIPAYNRVGYIKQTLDSINKQEGIEDFKNKIEIVISDNASNDGTSELIQDYMKSSTVKIVYNRSDNNMGADRNYLRVISLANGKYCWFLGSDDCIVNTGISRMLEKIKEECNIYLCGRYTCNCSELKIMGEEHFLLDWVKDKTFNFSNEREIFNYFDCCKSLGGLFSYLSSIVVLKQSWDSVKFDETYIGTAYSHVYILLNILKSNSKLKYIYEPLIMCRMGNDSFLDTKFQRWMLDIKGYIKLAEIFDESEPELKRSFLWAFARDYDKIKCLKMLLRLKKEQKEVIYDEMKKIGYDKSQIEELKRFCKFGLFFLVAFGLEKILLKLAWRKK